MKHLNAAEFVDLIESSPALAPDRIRHAETCARCRAEAQTLRDVRRAALADDGAEPSPLFWNHFAARVSAAVRNEPAPVAAAPPWFRRPAMTWATAVSIVTLIAAFTIWRATLHAPSPVVPATRQASLVDVVLPDPAAPEADDADTDEAWAVVRAAAVDLNWDDVHAAGIAAHPGDVENVALELNADERHELARLLNEDLKHNGA
jgi:hypothetical protein